LRVDD
jgi:hypothetical protein